MFGIDNYASFVAAIVAFQLIPGPGTLTILNATARHGIRSGMGSVFGTLTGDFLFMLAAVVGVAAVLSSLQWIGIVCRCWIGLKLLMGRASEGEDTALGPPFAFRSPLAPAPVGRALGRREGDPNADFRVS